MQLQKIGQCGVCVVSFGLTTPEMPVLVQDRHLPCLVICSGTVAPSLSGQGVARQMAESTTAGRGRMPRMRFKPMVQQCEPLPSLVVLLALCNSSFVPALHWRLYRARQCHEKN